MPIDLGLCNSVCFKTYFKKIIHNDYLPKSDDGFYKSILESLNFEITQSIPPGLLLNRRHWQDPRESVVSTENNNSNSRVKR
jgi:hypothetical protein